VGRRHDEIGRRPVASNGNIPDNGNAQEGFDIGVMWLGLKWVPEEQQNINFAFRDASADLLIAT
jgi:hypothetical protein